MYTLFDAILPKWPPSSPHSRIDPGLSVLQAHPGSSVHKYNVLIELDTWFWIFSRLTWLCRIGEFRQNGLLNATRLQGPRGTVPALSRTLETSSMKEVRFVEIPLFARYDWAATLGYVSWFRIQTFHDSTKVLICFQIKQNINKVLLFHVVYYPKIPSITFYFVFTWDALSYVI